MLAPNPQLLENAVLLAFSGSQRPKEADINEAAEKYRIAFPVSDEDFDAVIRRLKYVLTIELDTGTAVVEDHRPWLNARKANIDPYYWERYRKYLLGKMRLSPAVIQTLDLVTDEILDLAGDPLDAVPFSRKGLIVGEVQSGKTATYTALCCKAADARYKIIILLTGTIESLRRQTQERLDHGFAGRDSLAVLQRSNQIQKDLVVGAGIYGRQKFIPVFTSRASDFSIETARALNFSIANAADTILLVCKKNPKVLENLRRWLETYNANAHGKITAPLLLLDDEADNASINTNKAAENATRTNSEIRKLLSLFEHSTYIGVTATPFANVFIQPDTDDDMLGDDLFPRDFIYSLESPSNYIGPRAVFEDDPDKYIREFADMEAYLPLKHKVDHQLAALPESLKIAIRAFLLTTAIRDLRGEGPTHRSMLINVSRFTAVQDQIVKLVHAELDDIKRDIRLYSALDGDKACLSSNHLSALRAVWHEEFASGEFDWRQIQGALNAAIQPIAVRAVNQRAGAASLDYSSFTDNGLRVIAVGGNSLSRGLTLEGLSTSYFHRNSQMYDTLLQMGRWFGYRPEYDDLCRIWMTPDAASWYAHITLASEELRRELQRMRRLNRTPKDFGLKVRAHPDSLIVTARNKMRTAKDYVHLVSLSGEGFETTMLRQSVEINRENFAVTERFIKSLPATLAAKGRGNWPFWRGVPRSLISGYLSSLLTNPLNYNTQMDAIADFVATSNEPRIDKWDVAIVSPASSSHLFNIGGVPVRLPERRITLRQGSIWISGSKKRVGSPGDEALGLSDEQIARARELARKNESDSIPGKIYREVRERPLLLIYLIRGFEYLGAKKSAGTREFWPGEVPLVAASLSFPLFENYEAGEKAFYKINLVEFQSLYGDELGVDDDDDDTDDEQSIVA